MAAGVRVGQGERLRAVLRRRTERGSVVAAGERPLAWADLGRDVRGSPDPVATGGQWVGTSVALYLQVPAAVPDPSGRGAGGDPGRVGLESLRLPWGLIERADWEADTQVLSVVVRGGGASGGASGSASGSASGAAVTGRGAVHSARLLGADRLLQLVRERVTSALVHRRTVPLSAGGSLVLQARRAPATASDRPGQLIWSVQLPPGTDPDDPATQREVDAALAEARADLGVAR